MVPLGVPRSAHCKPFVRTRSMRMRGSAVFHPAVNTELHLTGFKQFSGALTWWICSDFGNAFTGIPGIRCLCVCVSGRI